MNHVKLLLLKWSFPKYNLDSPKEISFTHCSKNQVVLVTREFIRTVLLCFLIYNFYFVFLCISHISFLMMLYDVWRVGWIREGIEEEHFQITNYARCKLLTFLSSVASSINIEHIVSICNLSYNRYCLVITRRDQRITYSIEHSQAVILSKWWRAYQHQ